jgi:hypothetical protein
MDAKTQDRKRKRSEDVSGNEEEAEEGEGLDALLARRPDFRTGAAAPAQQARSQLQGRFPGQANVQTGSPTGEPGTSGKKQPPIDWSFISGLSWLTT